MDKYQDYISIIQIIIPKFNPKSLELPLNEADVDSIDIVTIRVKLEKFIGEKISDRDWMKFKTLLEIVNYCQMIKDSKL